MEALPWIQAAVGIGKMIQGSKTPKKPPTLGYDEAVQRASGVIDPMYDIRAKEALDALNNQLIARGFYGQRPGDTLVMDKMGDLEAQRMAQIAAMASDMVGRSEANALSEWALAQQGQRGDLSGGLGILGMMEYIPSLQQVMQGIFPKATTPQTQQFNLDPNIQKTAPRVDLVPSNMRQKWINPYGGGRNVTGIA